MKVYSATKQKTGESYFSTSASDLAGFVGCNATYLRDKLREKPVVSVKGFICSYGELNRIKRRGKFGH